MALSWGFEETAELFCRAGGDPGEAFDLDPIGAHRPAWMAEAACRTAELGLFFAEDPGAARAVCAGCGVREECLAYALAQGIPHGVFGGLDAGERRNLVRRRRRRGERRTTRVEDKRSWKRPNMEARHRALDALVDRHPDEYRTLLLRERAALGLTAPSRPRQREAAPSGQDR
jgi:WhiB family redox-sensing transcriptional regulator